MRIKLCILSFFALLLLWSSACRKDFEYDPSSGNLSFSKDTVFLDTVFSTIGSSTYALKVFNKTRDDLIIPSIRLGQGTESSYRLNVDGTAGKSFQDIPIFAQDSLFIFIETTVSLQGNPQNSLLYTDAIQFDSGEDQQEVQLVTLVKDAFFLYPSTNSAGVKETILLDVDDQGNEISVEGFELSDDYLNFTNEKPYVIYGYAVVPEGKELRIDPGARVHFHKDSGLLVSEGGSLSINGTLSEDQEILEGQVIFEGDRLEPLFSEIPGQWGTVWIANGSTGNTIDYLTIKNGSIGLFLEGDVEHLSPTLTIKNSQIYNNSNRGLWAKTAFVIAENLVLGAAGNSSLYCNLGGNYSFTHCTIANYWDKGFRTKSTLEIDNFILENSLMANDLVKADFKNCIIDGNGQIELSLNTNGENIFNFSFTNCMLKFNDSGNQFVNNPLYDFESDTNYNTILLNVETNFFLPTNNDFRMDLESETIDAGNTNFALEVPLDILGKDRTSNPDLGAYQASLKE